MVVRCGITKTVLVWMTVNNDEAVYICPMCV